jgi:guanylate kinase
MSAGGHGLSGVERRGLMFVLSSPSGAGKTTLSRLLIDKTSGLKMSVSATTLSAGQDVLFDIDWQGTQQLREKARADVVSVFILPPSAADLEKRLHSRAQDSDEVIRGRMDRASHEMSHWAEYDYIVINYEIDEAFAEVQSILKAERLKRERRTGLTTFVRKLQQQLEK